jgi:DNA-directed RNA polymerase specialized sigma24 family protein
MTTMTKRTRATSTANTDATLLVHPELVRTVQRTLRRYGMAKGNLEDGVAEVQTRALEYLRTRQPPTDLAGWVALCVTIAKHWRLNEKEKKRARSQYDTGPCEEPDEQPPPEPAGEPRDPVDVARMMAVLEQQIEAGQMPEHAVEILDASRAGETSEAIGAELGISAQVVRHRRRKMKKVLGEQLAALGLVAGEEVELPRVTREAG